MLNPASLMASVALFLPLAAAQAPVAVPADGLAPEAVEQEPAAFDSGEDAAYRVSLEANRAPKVGQVRIEQRVVIRISPRPRATRQDLLAQLPRGEVATRLEERPMGKCVAVQRIAGVGTTNDNRLVLFMNDRRIVSARLEKSCKPEDFYSGFYVERNEDGMLCVKRDELQSRAGAKCGVDSFRQLVAVPDE
jgi:hypothetical protein